MHRLFIAARPPAAIRALLLDLMGDVSGARWQDEDQLHLTLRFIGEVDRHVAADVHGALCSVHHPAFDLAISGLGLFDRRGIPETLWAGITPHQPAHALHKKVDQALTRTGIAPDTRAFHPHITLARLNRSSGPVHAFLATQDGISSPAFAVSTFGLYESHLTPEGAVYYEVERYSLHPTG